MEKTKGFFTVATGKEHYYIIARNLLRSYRKFTRDPLPFAILADRENEYTKEFDKVVIIEHPTNSYLDKLSLYQYLPFDTGIFIDADCLAYGDLNEIFDHFKNANDFSCYGRVLPLEDKTGWFNYEDLGPLQSRVQYCVGLHGGIYYLRRTEKTRELFETAKEISEHYNDFNFKGKFATPGDEPIIALSMALNQMKPIPFHPDGITCYWEYEHTMQLSMTKGYARNRTTGQQVHLVHWGTRFTRELNYQRQVSQMEHPGQWLPDIQYQWKILVQRCLRFTQRVVNKICRMLHLA